MPEKIKVGVWGLGRAGWNMHLSELDSMPELFDVVAACELLPERREEFVRRYPCARAYTEAEAFLHDSNVELVAIVTRSTDHIGHAEAALKAGKTVFLEKPIALDFAGAKKVLALSEKYPGRLFIRHNRRFEAAFNHLREIIASGILGKVYEIKLCRHRFQLRNDWQTLESEGGGQLNNWAPHLIDHALLLLESELSGLWCDRKLVASLGDTEDNIKIIFRGANGRVVDLEISDGVAIPGDVYSVYGTRGTLVSHDEKEFRMRYIAPKQQLPPHGAAMASPARDSGYGAEFKIDWIEKTIPVAPANGFVMDRIYQYLYEAVRQHRPFPVTVEQAVEVVRVTEQVKQQCALQIWN